MHGCSRRSFLATTAGLLVAGPTLLAACGGDDQVDGQGGGSGGTDIVGDLALALFLKADAVTAGQQRWVFGLADKEKLLDGTQAPAEITVHFQQGGEDVLDPVVATRHAKGLSRAYFPVRTSITAPGTFDIVAEAAGQEPTTTVVVVDPATRTVPAPGEPMMPLDTPTTADGRGVDPICTAEPMCDLHEVTLTEALGEGRPIAYLVATPAYCAQATCGPVLDVLRSAGAGFGDRLRMLHAEVYTDRNHDVTTAAVDTYRLDYEPVLFLADATGTIVDRLDVLFDEDEVRESLERLVGA